MNLKIEEKIFISKNKEIAQLFEKKKIDNKFFALNFH